MLALGVDALGEVDRAEGAELGDVDRAGARDLHGGLLAGPAVDGHRAAQRERADHGGRDDEADRGDEVVGAGQAAGGEEGAEAALLGGGVSARAAIRTTQIADLAQRQADERGPERARRGRARRPPARLR